MSAFFTDSPGKLVRNPEVSRKLRSKAETGGIGLFGRTKERFKRRIVLQTPDGAETGSFQTVSRAIAEILLELEASASAPVPESRFPGTSNLDLLV